MQDDYDMTKGYNIYARPYKGVILVMKKTDNSGVTLVWSADSPWHNPLTLLTHVAFLMRRETAVLYIGAILEVLSMRMSKSQECLEPVPKTKITLLGVFAILEIGTDEI